MSGEPVPAAVPVARARLRVAGVLLILAAVLVLVAAVVGAAAMGGWVLVAAFVWFPIYGPTLCAVPFVLRLGWRLLRARPPRRRGLLPLAPFAWLPAIGVVAGRGWPRGVAALLAAVVVAVVVLARPTEPPS